MTPTRIRFQGNVYWFHDEGDGNGALAYTEHCTPDGHVTLESALLHTSYAHAFFGQVLRFGKLIGTTREFEYL